MRSALWWIVSAFVLAGCRGAEPEPADRQPDSEIWDLTEGLTAEQLRINRAIYAALEPDACDRETDYDREARALASSWPEIRREALRELNHGGTREQQAAAGRAYVWIAQRAVTDGRYDVAAELSLDTFLSSTPHRVRLEALRVYCRAADPMASERWIELIASGRQDRRFQPILPELRAAREARRAELANR